MSENKKEDFNYDEIQRKERNRSRNRILLFSVIGILFLLLAVFLFQKVNPSNKKVESFTSVKEVKPNNPKKEYSEALDFQEIDLGELDETVFKGKRDNFDVFFNNDEKVNEYGFYQDNQQSELFIIPTSTKYEVEVTNIELKGKEITITYEYGNPKIPRLIGHITKFSGKAYVIDFRHIDSAIYELTLINEKEEEIQSETLDFTKPFYRGKKNIVNLTWGEEDQLIFASDIDGDWELFAYNIYKDDSPIKLTDRHKDYELNTFVSLGVENINIPTPLLNNTTNKIIYHAEQDIYEVGTNGKNNYPLSRFNDEYPIEEGMYQFNHEPKPTNKGDYIYFRRIYDPEHSELWKMYYDGSNQKRVSLPQDGYVEEFIISPNDDQLAVILSKRESELMNGRDNLWILPLKGESEEPRKISTVGYSVKDIDFSKNNKTIAFSMKEQATSSELSTDIWTVNSNNTELKRLTPNDNYMDVKPVWSPDGNRIAYLSGDGNGLYLSLMDKNGDGRRILDNSIKVTGKPLWSPNGEDIFISDIRGNIFKYNLEEDKVYIVLEGY